MIHNLNAFRDWRDMMTEQMFFGIYSLPWVQALVGLKASDAPPRKLPGKEPDHLALIAQRKKELLSKIEEGGPREALLRGLIYVRLPVGAADERGFEVIRRIRAEQDDKSPLSEFKQAFREQFFMVLLDEEKAVVAIPKLLEGYPDHGPELYKMILEIATVDSPLGEEADRRLAEIEPLFAAAPKTAFKKEQQSQTVNYIK
jgi:hypothetical protein